MDSPLAEKPETRTLTKTGRLLVVLMILAIGGGLSAAAVKFGKKAEEAPAKRPIPDVQLVTTKAEDVVLTLESQGLVQAVTETRAAAEVPGRVIRVRPRGTRAAVSSSMKNCSPWTTRTIKPPSPVPKPPPPRLPSP